MKKCLICTAPVRFIKFKCQDGHVCKTCYEKVSLNFSQTIKTKTKEELIAIHQEQSQSSAVDDFEISRKINQLVLFDDTNKQFCLPNHLKYSGETLQPEFYPFTAIQGCRIEEHQVLKEDKDKGKSKKLGTIKVVLNLNDGQEALTRNIWLIPNPIQIDNRTYQTMMSLAQKVTEELNQTKERVLIC